jgi:hypothetical protein
MRVKERELNWRKRKFRDAGVAFSRQTRSVRRVFRHSERQTCGRALRAVVSQN